jgi:hypothetical protein
MRKLCAMRKLWPGKLWLLLILATSLRWGAQPFAWGQSIPPPAAAFIWNGSAWTQATTTATLGAISYVPPAIALYCYNSTTRLWVPADSSCFGGSGGTGTVTSVALTGSGNIFSPTPGTAVTTSGTLNVDSQLLAQVANCVLAGPTTGSAAAPTCRALVNADFPGTLAPTILLTNMTGTLTSPTLVTPALGTPASGVITNLTGTCTACTANAATTATTATSATTAANLSGGGTITGTPALSTSAIESTVAIFTGGSGTTTFPYWLIQPSGATAATTWLTAGTLLGINAPSGFAGELIDFRSNGGSGLFQVNTGGSLTYAGSLTGTNSGLIIQNNVTATAKLASSSIVSWSSTAVASGTQDTGLDRSAAGVVEVNLGTASGSGGSLKAQKILSSTNCSNGASPAVCGSAAAGSVAIPTGTNPTLVVNTTAVTAASQILLTVDDSVTIGGTTCNSTLATLVGGMAITARTAATSFTISFNGTVAVNPVCLSYLIVN